MIVLIDSVEALAVLSEELAGIGIAEVAVLVGGVKDGIFVGADHVR